MLPKIRYRLVWNYAGRLNREGRAPVAVEARQNRRKIYLSTRVMLCPHQWHHGAVVSHPNAEKMTAYLYRRLHEIEEIELDALLKGKHLSLFQLKTAVRTGVRANATITKFIGSVITDSSNRGKSTKQGYRYLANDICERYGQLTLHDITYDFIERYRSDMRRQNLSENTVKGRLKQLRCLVNEGIKRNLITDDPFKFISIGNMSARHGFLTRKEVEKIERQKLDRKERHIRDAFVFCCYTGLRYSDFVNLRSVNIKDDIMSLSQQKTRNPLSVPLRYLFGGKPLEILSRYKTVEGFARIGCNTTANRALKEIGRKAKIEKRLFWHLARHTCATLLNEAGLQMQEIQKILGHSKLETTSTTYAETSLSQVSKSLKKAFKNDKNFSVDGCEGKE